MNAWVHVPREPDTTLRVDDDRAPWPAGPRCVHGTSDGGCPRPARDGSEACVFHDPPPKAPESPVEAPGRLRVPNLAPLTPKQARRATVGALRAQGLDPAAIAVKLDISESTVHRDLRNQT